MTIYSLPRAACATFACLALAAASHLTAQRLPTTVVPEHYALTRDFLNDPDRYLKRLLAEARPDSEG